MKGKAGALSQTPEISKQASDNTNCSDKNLSQLTDREIYYTLSDAARLKGKSKYYIRMLVYSGKLKVVRVGKFYRIPESELFKGA